MTEELRPALLRMAHAARYLGIAESTLWAKVKNEPGWPQPVRLSAGVTAMRTDDLDALIDRLAVESQAAA